jgi:tetratricopeptide (TPR) repeat protein
VALAAAPRLAEARYLRAKVRSERGDLAGALADADAAMALGLPGGAALAVRAWVLHRLGRDDEALAVCDRALALEPSLAESHGARGMVRDARRDWAGARADYDAALALDARYASVRSARAWLRHRQGDRDGARADYTAALEIDPRLLQALHNFAILEYQDGRFEAARGLLDRLLAVEAGDVEALVLRALVQLSLKADAAADRDAADALAQAPDHPNGLIARGTACMRLARHADAIAAFQRYLAVAPNTPQVPKVREWLARCEADARAAGG